MALSAPQIGDDVATIAQTFGTVSLEEAMAMSLLDRVDTKTVVPMAVLPRILRATAGHYWMVEAGGTISPTYTSKYFDTPNLDFYLEHHNGHRVRHKLRYRRYHSTDTMFFEVKQRAGRSRTRKTRVEVDELPDALGPAELRLVERCGVTAPGVIPTLNVIYDRMTLLGGNERVTVDLALTCQARNGRSVTMPNFAIVEIKQPRRRYDSPIFSALRDQSVRPRSISKYCVGIVSCFDDVKSNRFKQKLSSLQLQPTHTP